MTMMPIKMVRQEAYVVAENMELAVNPFFALSVEFFQGASLLVEDVDVLEIVYKDVFAHEQSFQRFFHIGGRSYLHDVVFEPLKVEHAA